MSTNTKNLNELQLHFLQFFSEVEVSEQETKDIKNMVSKYYFEKAEKAIEKAIKDKNIDVLAMEKDNNLHHRISKKE
jgi:hypothetical protein